MKAIQLNNMVTNIHKQFKANQFPINSFLIADYLGLIVKDKSGYVQDNGNSDILNNCRAIYALHKGEYTIYYNENSENLNFIIAHEIAHHLLHHTGDGISQHHDANLLAAMLIAPKDLVSIYSIKSGKELSEMCGIPLVTAMEYWNYIDTQYKKSTSDCLKEIHAILDNTTMLLHNIEHILQGGVGI